MYQLGSNTNKCKSWMVITWYICVNHTDEVIHIVRGCLAALHHIKTSSTPPTSKNVKLLYVFGRLRYSSSSTCLHSFNSTMCHSLFSPSPVLSLWRITQIEGPPPLVATTSLGAPVLRGKPQRQTMAHEGAIAAEDWQQHQPGAAPRGKLRHLAMASRGRHSPVMP
jgi:hypothetical protein